MVAFCSDDPSSNPADTYIFSVDFVLEKNEKTKRGRSWPIYLKSYLLSEVTLPKTGTVVEAQLLPTPEVRGSNPVIRKKFATNIFTVN